MDGGQWNALRLGHYAYYSTPGHGRHAGRAGHDRHVRAPVPAVRGHGGAHGLARRRARPAPGRAARRRAGHGGRWTRTRSARWGRRWAARSRALRARLEEHRAAGRRVYGYAAASRAVSLLCLVGADRTPARRGRRRLPGQARKAHAGHRRAGDLAGGARGRGAGRRAGVRLRRAGRGAARAAPDPRRPLGGRRGLPGTRDHRLKRAGAGWRVRLRPARCAPARWSACARRSAAPSPAARRPGRGAASPAAGARSRPATPRRSAR